MNCEGRIPIHKALGSATFSWAIACKRERERARAQERVQRVTTNNNKQCDGKRVAVVPTLTHPRTVGVHPGDLQPVGVPVGENVDRRGGMRCVDLAQERASGHVRVPSALCCRR